jgi:hypothetical protein
MNDRTDAILASIDGALADEGLRDGMRWSPEPEKVIDAPEPFDGSLVWQPPQSYEDAGTSLSGSLSDAEPPHDLAQYLPQISVRRGGVQYRRFTDPEPAELLSERARLISEGVPASALVRPLDPDAWRPVGTLTPESTADLHRSISDAVNADLAARADRIASDARAMIPRISDHVPPLALDHNAHTSLLRGRGRYDEAGLLIVEEHTSGLTTVRRATPEEVGQFVNDAWQVVVEGFTPLFEQIRDAFRAFTDTLRRAGVAPTGPPTTPEARRSLGLPPLSPADARTAALMARRHRNTGPAPLGPERSPRPRTHQ